MADAATPALSRVLVATDRSETAARAVAWAAELARRFEAELFVLQVIVPGLEPGPQEAAQFSYAVKDLELYAQELAGERGRSKVVVDDDPSAAIVEAAEEEGADVRRGRQRGHERPQGVPARQRAQPGLAQCPLHGDHRQLDQRAR